MNHVWLDFEYHRDIGEKNVRLICASVLSDKHAEFFDLRSGDVAPLIDVLRQYDTIGCYSSSAEATGLLALGLNPLQWQWVDLYFMFSLLVNGVYNELIFGGDNDITDEDDPDSEDADDSGMLWIKKKKTKIRRSMLNACLMLGVNYNHDKEKTLETILNSEIFTNAEWDDIKTV